MSVTVLNRWQAKCPSCPAYVWWERLKTDTVNTREVVISRCPSCDKR